MGALTLGSPVVGHTGATMLSDQELEVLLLDLESDYVERKQSLADSERIREAICAFANDLPGRGAPGVVFVGVRDDGSCANFAVSDEALVTVANLRSDGNILPFPAITVQKRRLNGCDILVVEVAPSESPPVRVRGRTCVRIGPRRAIATPEEERRLTEKRRSRDLPFDQHPLADATLDELDLDLFRRVYLPSAVPLDVLEQNQRSTQQQLASMRLVAAREPVPTVAGMLVLGKDARRWIPGAYLQFLRFDGRELVDPVKSQREVDGPLPDQLRSLDELLEINISVSAEFAGQPVEVRHADYPLLALQQLARNAILHRTYEATNSPVRLYWFSDRIEITNPGGPFGQVTSENFGQAGITDYRNPQLAESMKVLGYVQRFGVGIPLARSELRKNGNPPPLFDVTGSHVLVTVRARRSATDG